jgi:hypothetical protein
MDKPLLLVPALAPLLGASTAYAGALVTVGTDAPGRPMVGDAGGAPPAEPLAPFDIPSYPLSPSAPATPEHPATHKVFTTTSNPSPRSGP